MINEKHKSITTFRIDPTLKFSLFAGVKPQLGRYCPLNHSAILKRRCGYLTKKTQVAIVKIEFFDKVREADDGN